MARGHDVSDRVLTVVVISVVFRSTR